MNPTRFSKRLEWVAWTFLFVVWTFLLLRPEPAAIQNSVVPSFWRYPLAKSIHVGAYAILTAWGLSLSLRGISYPAPSPGSQQTFLPWWPLPLLSFHGAVTEFLQTMVKDRTGSIWDVCWDHLGIILGLAIWYLFIQNRKPRFPTGKPL